MVRFWVVLLNNVVMSFLGGRFLRLLVDRVLGLRLVVGFRFPALDAFFLERGVWLFRNLRGVEVLIVRFYKSLMMAPKVVVFPFAVI